MVAAVRIRLFDTWRPNYQGAVVSVFVAGTTDLADLFLDEGLTQPAVNPQTLLSGTPNGVDSGKFTQPLYTGDPYYVDVASREQTGIERLPLYALDGENASLALVTATGASAARTLASRAADEIWATDYGAIGISAATNTTTITAAIGAAAANGGGIVRLPAGDPIPFTVLTLPENVRLAGWGRGATTLQSEQQQAVILLTGTGAGLQDLTLDGVSVQASSVGIYSVGQERSFLRDVEVTRFATGMHFKGHAHAEWQNLTVAGCTNGAKLHGDTDAGAGALGTVFRMNAWHGGLVTDCTSIGVELSYEDAVVEHNVLADIVFDTNGIALKVNGARWTHLEHCEMVDNTNNITLLDDDAAIDTRRVTGFEWEDGRMHGGTVTFTGKCQDIALRRLAIEDVDFTLTIPENVILLEDCVEDALVTIAGSGEKYTRDFSTYNGSNVGVTTGAVATKAWSITLKPGELASFKADVLGNQVNGVNTGSYVITATAKRAGATLAYKTQTANFTVGLIVTGATSGAKGLIIADADGGATGTLTLRAIQLGPTGLPFQNNEIITDSATGSATVNGSISVPAVSILDQDTLTTSETNANWAVAFAGVGPDLELQVTGDTAQTVTWLSKISMLRNG